MIMSDQIKPYSPYHLQTSNCGKKQKGTCPSCGKKKRFTFYVYTGTNEIVNEKAGRCDRENSCGYHATPNDVASDILPQSERPVFVKQQKPIPNLLPFDFVSASAKKYDQNHFFSFLVKVLGYDRATLCAGRYKLGTSKRWQGANLFWLIDIDGNVRTGKAMCYNPETGKRDKDKNDWVHSMLKRSKRIDQYTLVQCYFGEHLLQEPSKPVAIVESEKTAMVMSELHPKYIWLATGGKTGIKWLEFDNSDCLKGRDVTLFPDKGCFNDWRKVGEKLSYLGVNCSVSDFLESTDLPDGADLLDGLDL